MGGIIDKGYTVQYAAKQPAATAEKNRTIILEVRTWLIAVLGAE